MVQPCGLLLLLLVVACHELRPNARRVPRLLLLLLRHAVSVAPRIQLSTAHHLSTPIVCARIRGCAVGGMQLSHLQRTRVLRRMVRSMLQFDLVMQLSHLQRTRALRRQYLQNTAKSDAKGTQKTPVAIKHNPKATCMCAASLLVPASPAPCTRVTCAAGARTSHTFSSRVTVPGTHAQGQQYPQTCARCRLHHLYKTAPVGSACINSLRCWDVCAAA
jgi:hypothetical protein